MTRLDWEDLKVFVALARGGSMRAAGSELGIHASTVARRLEQLEKKLGTRLFDRGGLALTLTSSGEELRAYASRVEREIEGLELHLFGRDDRMAGPLRLSLPDVVATPFLLEDVARFAAQYPDIAIELLPSYEVVDLARRQADVAIRVTTTPPEHLVGRKLASFALSVYASPTYLETHDPVNAPEKCAWLGWGPDTVIDDRVQAWFPGVPVKTLVRNVPLQASAARAGLGMAILPCGVGDVDRGLVRVPPARAIRGGDLWVLTHPELRSAARIRAFLECCTQSFRSNQASMMGGINEYDVAPA